MDLASIPSPAESVWHLGPLPIRAYALCLIAGIVVACWIAEARMRRRGAPKWAVLDLAVWAVPFGIVGARIYHVFTSPDAYFGPDGDPWKTLAVWEGGLGIPGAVLLGGVGVWLGCRQLKLPFTMVADAIVPGIPVAQAIGRLGNWFNQELYGKPLEAWFAVAIDEDHRVDGYEQFATFHPTFLYELLWNLGVGAAVLLADRRAKFGAGRAVALYVALYGVGRFWIEGLRIDEAQVFWGLRLNQWTSIIIVVCAVAYLLLVRGTRQVFVVEDGVRTPVAWNSEAALAAGYVDGGLPKGVLLHADGDGAEPDRPRPEAAGDEPPSADDGPKAADAGTEDTAGDETGETGTAAADTTDSTGTEDTDPAEQGPDAKTGTARDDD